MSQAKGPLDVLESRVRNLLIDHADLKERLDRASRREGEARKRLLLAVVGVKDAAEDYLLDAEGKEADALATRYLRDVCVLLGKLLAANQVEPVGDVGQPPDGRWHRVLEAVADGAAREGTIVRQVRKAYRWKEEVLREGQVVIARRGE